MLAPALQEPSMQQATPAWVPHAAHTPPWQRVPLAVQMLPEQHG
jgi:hypothetical protein